MVTGYVPALVMPAMVTVVEVAVSVSVCSWLPSIQVAVTFASSGTPSTRMVS